MFLISFEVCELTACSLIAFCPCGTTHSSIILWLANLATSSEERSTLSIKFPEHMGCRSVRSPELHRHSLCGRVWLASLWTGHCRHRVQVEDMEVLTVGVGGIAFTAQADLQSRWHMAADSDPGSLGQCFVLQSTLCFSPAVWFPVPDWNLPALVSLSSVSTHSLLSSWGAPFHPMGWLSEWSSCSAGAEFRLVLWKKTNKKHSKIGSSLS